MNRRMARRNLCFGVFFLLSVLLFWKPLKLLLYFSFQNVHLSHIFLIPLLSLILIWWERKGIFSSVRSSYGSGLLLLSVAAVLYGVAFQNPFLLSQHDYLSASTLALVFTWLAIFALCYGSASFQAAAFPLLFLLLMVPVPELLLGRIISALQEGSAALAHGLFKLSGVPTYRDGFYFTLPGLTIEVAEECSGIRSSIALFVTSLLAGHLSLRTGWGRLSLILLVIPLALLKNAVRIVVITLLGLYVDRGFLTGYLHHRGGIVFFLFSVALLVIVLGVLQRLEDRNRRDGGALSQGLMKFWPWLGWGRRESRSP